MGRFDVALGKTIPIQVEFPGNLRDFIAVCILDKIIEKKRGHNMSLAMKEAYLQAENFLDARGMSREELQKSVNEDDIRAIPGGEPVREEDQEGPIAPRQMQEMIRPRRRLYEAVPETEPVRGDFPEATREDPRDASVTEAPRPEISETDSMSENKVEERGR